MDDLIIHLDDPDWDDRRISLDVPLEPLQAPGSGPVPVRAHLEGTVRRVESRTRLEGRLEATLELSCSRCLEPHPFAVASDVVLTLVREAFAEIPRGEGPIDAAAVDDSLFHAAEGLARLDDIVREQLYLHLPLRSICRPDCQGLCPTCGANRNGIECGCSEDEVDPRLAPLLRFRSPDRGGSRGDDG